MTLWASAPYTADSWRMRQTFAYKTVLQLADLGALPVEPLGELPAGEPTARTREPEFAEPRTQCVPCLLIVGAHQPRALFGRGELVERHRVVRGRVADDGVSHDLSRFGDQLDVRDVVGVVEVQQGNDA